MEPSDILLKVQAFVDGELPASEQSEIAALIARDADVHALVKELKQTRQALAGFEGDVRLPESAEFHWSMIRRKIERLPQPVTQVAAEPRSLKSIFARWLLPMGAVTAAAVAMLLLVRGSRGDGYEMAWTSDNDAVSAFTYRDYEEGMTLMWLSYPGDSAVANSSKPATLN